MSDTLGADIERLLLKSGKELVEEITEVIRKHGVEAVRQWKTANKGDGLIHIFASNGVYVATSNLLNYRLEGVTELVRVHGFDLNKQRTGDSCTPLHLASWRKQSDMMSVLLGKPLKFTTN